MTGGKTVVRIRLASPELTKTLCRAGARGFSGELQGTLLQGETVQKPPSGDGEPANGAAFSYSFLRAVARDLSRETALHGSDGGHVLGDGEVEISVLEVSNAFVRRWPRPTLRRFPTRRRS